MNKANDKNEKKHNRTNLHTHTHQHIPNPGNNKIHEIHFWETFSKFLSNNFNIDWKKNNNENVTKKQLSQYRVYVMYLCIWKMLDLLCFFLYIPCMSYDSFSV